jgi:tyrosyl-tRNA synthetase
MGKTADGAVWLNRELFSPYKYWQFWRDTSDADVGRFLRLFTELPLDEIARLEALQGNELDSAKKILADEATRLCHGNLSVTAVSATSAAVFGGGPSIITIVGPRGQERELSEQGNTIFSVTYVSASDAEYTYTSLPVLDVPQNELLAGIPVYALLTRAGLTASNGEARRLIKGGGARINDEAVTDEAATVSLATARDGVIKLSAGRKKHVLVRAG